MSDEYCSGYSSRTQMYREMQFDFISHDDYEDGRLRYHLLIPLQENGYCLWDRGPLIVSEDGEWPDNIDKLYYLHLDNAGKIAYELREIRKAVLALGDLTPDQLHVLRNIDEWIYKRVTER